jgi:hypothetical protein
MKKMFLLLSVSVMVLGIAFSAQAAPTIIDPWNPAINTDELNLYEIFADSHFMGVSYLSSQAIANSLNIVETLPANVQIQVTAYATFAGFTQNPGFYSAGNTSSLQYMTPSFTNAFPANTDGIFSINDWKAGTYNTTGTVGFFDNTSGGGIKYTELALNSGGLGQSNGLIFKISDNHYIVAFEDGAGAKCLGDKDYNDLVLNVTTRPVPAPASAFLLGSGLIGLVGTCRRRFTA